MRRDSKCNSKYLLQRHKRRCKAVEYVIVAALLLLLFHNSRKLFEKTDSGLKCTPVDNLSRSLSRISFDARQ